MLERGRVEIDARGTFVGVMGTETEATIVITSWTRNLCKTCNMNSKTPVCESNFGRVFQIT